MANAFVSIEDLRNMYVNSLVIFKNKPVYVVGILDKITFKVFDLVSQRNINIKVDSHEDLKAPGRCLGFININGYVVYMARNPVRRYRVGITADNAAFSAPEGYQGILGHAKAQSVYSFMAPEIVDAVFDRYPTIDEAYKEVERGVSKIVAFDRQFAIDSRGVVFYKTKRVGVVNKRPTSVYDIKFVEQYQHLIILLDNNYEKSASVPR